MSDLKTAPSRGAKAAGATADYLDQRTGVGNAVNETVVFTFMALFAINIVATAVAIRITQ